MESHERQQLPPLIGRYHVIRLIGQGAMGRVLLAHDPVLDRDVAVKLLREDLGLTREQRRALLDRMRQEARASARVSHPHIIALYDMGEDESLGLYLVFEYAAGTTLKEQLTHGALAPGLVAQIALAMGHALDTAHEHGILHRDIKPENVLLTKVGPKVADFGIARVPDSTLTRDGGLLGTPAYSAPEAIANSAFSPLSDQFSMAATLWEALTGRRAFPGDDAVAVASRIATEEPPTIAPLCGLDPRVDTILARGLSKNPRARFATCEEFGRALADALEVKQQISRAPAPLVVRGGAGRKALGMGLTGLLVGIGLGASGALWSIHRSSARPLPVVSVEPVDSPESRPIGYLAERPPPKKKKKPREFEADAGEDAGDPDAGVDAAAEPDTTPSQQPPPLPSPEAPSEDF